MKVDSDNYDYIMYVDASGDDGFHFETDTSICYAAAALLVKREDISHNLEFLSAIKRTVGCKETDEVKYSKVRRNRHGSEALSLLKNLHGSLSAHVVFKKEVDPKQYVGNKTMSVACHYMALRAVDSCNLPSNSKVLIAIDRMKKAEEVPLSIVVSSRIKEGKQSQATDVIFRDSKDSNFQLIQIADLLCGIIREHFEQYETNKNMIYFKSVCPPCIALFQIKRNNTRIQCKAGKSQTQKIINSKNLKYIWGLFPQTENTNFLDYFFTEPIAMMNQNFYLVCCRKK